MIIGLLAGLVGGVVNLIGYSIISVLMLLIFAGIGAASAPSNNAEQFALSAMIGGVGSVFWIIFNAILIIPIALFGLLGGLIGVSIFEKRPPAMQPPPQNYGNFQQGGGNFR